MVNGQTGKVQGEAPISWLKVLLAVLIVIALLACFFFVVSLFEGTSSSTSMVAPVAQWVAAASRIARMVT
jgi:hypothetical protein